MASQSDNRFKFRTPTLDTSSHDFQALLVKAKPDQHSQPNPRGKGKDLAGLRRFDDDSGRVILIQLFKGSLGFESLD
jgi:hypothetical protein